MSSKFKSKTIFIKDLVLLSVILKDKVDLAKEVINKTKTKVPIDKSNLHIFIFSFVKFSFSLSFFHYINISS